MRRTTYDSESKYSPFSTITPTQRFGKSCTQDMKKILFLLLKLLVVGEASLLNNKGFKIGDAYDPRYESCCGETPYSLADRYQFLKCCGNLQYDVTDQVCCDGVVHSLQGGFGCCGQKYFNLTQEYCCPEAGGVFQVKPVPEPLMEKGIGKFLNCCCHEPYDTRTQLCCGCAIIAKTASNVTCCGSSTYVPSPGFECCNGSVVSFPDQNYACCGNESFNTLTYFCCGIKNYERLDRNKHRPNYYGYRTKDACCGDQRYDGQVQLCCNSDDGKQFVVTPPGSLGYYGCCGTEHYHTNSEMCCDVNGTKVVRKKSIFSHTACCVNETFDSRYNICCNNVIMEKSYNQNSCCGPYPYSNWSQICCYDDELRQHRAYQQQYGSHCCGVVPYYPSRETCLNKQVMPVTRSFHSCDGKRYKPDEALCCNGSVIEKVERNATYACCGNNGYQLGKAICCYGVEVRPITHPGQTSCCVMAEKDRYGDMCCPCIDLPYTHSTYPASRRPFNG